MSGVKLKIKIFLKVIFHSILGRTRLKAWILRKFSRDYELDSAKLAELISKPLSKDTPKGDFIASLTSFPARVGILKYALHSIFSQDLQAKRVILVLSVDEFLDSANLSPSYLSNSHISSQKGLHPSPRSPYAPKSSAFSLLGGEPRLSASSKKSAGGTTAPFDSDFLHHEAGEFSGASHKIDLDSANLINSQNLDKIQSRVAQPLKASSGEGEGSDFAIRKNPCIQAPAPSLKENARSEKWESNADLSAKLRKKIDSANLSQGGLQETSHSLVLPREQSSLAMTDFDRLPRSPMLARNDGFNADSAFLENLLPAEILAFKKFGLEIMWVEKNLRQYNKIIPILRAFPRENIITLDDDIYYNPRTFSTLYNAHLSNRRAIWAHKARIVPFSAHKIADFFEWKIIRKRNKKSQNLPKFNIFLEGCGGVFYPPNALHSDCTNEAKFMDLAPKADDIWLWAMALLKGTKIACVKPPLMGDGAAFTNPADNPALWHYNMNGGNDRQMRAILAEYPQILRILAEEKVQERAQEASEKAQEKSQ